MRHALNAAAGAASLLLSLCAGCHCGGGAIGDPCTSASDCNAGLRCDPSTRRCTGGESDGAATDATGPGTDSAPPGTDSAPPGTDAAPPGTDSAPPGTDATPPGTDSAPSSTDAGAGGVIFCSDTSPCPAGQMCKASFCSSSGEGFCLALTGDTCGGFVFPPAMCADPTDTCLDSGCVADVPGGCVSVSERATICAMQPTLWMCP